MLDWMVDKQKERIVRETLTLEHATLALESALDKADALDNPVLEQVLPWLRSNELWAARFMNDFLLSYALGERPKMGAGWPSNTSRIRRKLILGLRRSKERLTRQQREEKVASLSDEQIMQAVNQVRRETGAMTYEGPAEGVGDWLSGAWQWLCDNWLTILQAIAAILGILILI